MSDPMTHYTSDSIDDASIHVSFICSGNICRSPYAEYYVRHVANSQSWGDKVQFSSASTLGLDDRPAHEKTIELAARDGLDLRPHRSQPLSLRYVKSCDLLLCMEVAHVVTLRKVYPDYSDRFYLLNAYPEDSLDRGDIPDPIGRDEAVFQVAHAAIREASQAIIEQLGGMLRHPA